MKIVVHQQYQSRSIRDVLSEIKALVAEGTQLSRQSGDAQHTVLLDKLAGVLGMQDISPFATHSSAVGWPSSFVPNRALFFVYLPLSFQRYPTPPTQNTPTSSQPVARKPSLGSRIVRPGSTTAIPNATQLAGQPTTGSPSTKNYTTVFFTPERPLTKGGHPRDPETFCTDSEGKTFRMSRVLTDDERLAICQGRCRQMQKKAKEGWFALVILPPQSEAANGNGELEDEGAVASSKKDCRDLAGTSSTTPTISSSSPLPSSVTAPSPPSVSMPPPLFPASALRLSPRKKTTSLPSTTNKAPNLVAQQPPRVPVPDKCMNGSSPAPDASRIGGSLMKVGKPAAFTTAAGAELQVIKPLKRSRDEDEEHKPSDSSTVAPDTKKRRVGAAVDVVISPTAPELQHHTALVRCTAGGNGSCRCPICDKAASFKFTFTCPPPKPPASPMFTFGQSSNSRVTRSSSPPMLTSSITASGPAPPTQAQEMLVASPLANPLKRSREDDAHNMSNESPHPATRQRTMSSDDVPDSSVHFTPSDPTRSRSAPPANYVMSGARAVAVAEHGMTFGNRLKGAKNL
ncbi:hypothetical protein NLJ89_g6004 [Agrocybe chaxingu]|uniref:Uncharacterized protein n=1 Tax=Agrocybe chaxingu TaxID=84603 RepID=A0A9W8MUH5_9AGAR|nr:hypothetical protein NLJ89_g6004 [Agrocybe chaxingu]